jgi:putative endonuclease
MKYFYVYILECSDKTLYTGMTNDIDRRLEEHQRGINESCYTYKRRPVRLVYSQIHYSFTQAESWEKRIKKWSQKKKWALIKGDDEVLKKAAECTNETHCRNR